MKRDTNNDSIYRVDFPTVIFPHLRCLLQSPQLSQTVKAVRYKGFEPPLFLS